MKKIIFFDGVCNLCNGFVDFMIRRDRDGLFCYAPLQGSTAAQVLGRKEVMILSTVIFYDGGKMSRKSEAVIRSVSQLGGGWRWVRILLLIPRPLRDVVYDFVVMYRYQIFGRRTTCRLPTPEEKSRFLD